MEIKKIKTIILIQRRKMKWDKKILEKKVKILMEAIAKK
jgi:hypothetical protein